MTKWQNQNRRRGELMDKEDVGTLNAGEAAELKHLQAIADQRITDMKPTMLDGADELIEDLKRRGQWTVKPGDADWAQWGRRQNRRSRER